MCGLDQKFDSGITGSKSRNLLIPQKWNPAAKGLVLTDVHTGPGLMGLGSAAPNHQFPPLGCESMRVGYVCRFHCHVFICLTWGLVWSELSVNIRWMDGWVDSWRDGRMCGQRTDRQTDG